MLCANNILGCCSQIKVTGERLLTPSPSQLCFLVPQYLRVVSVMPPPAAFNICTWRPVLRPCSTRFRAVTLIYSHHQPFFFTMLSPWGDLKTFTTNLKTRYGERKSFFGCESAHGSKPSKAQRQTAGWARMSPLLWSGVFPKTISS